jgi:hypothetical protein
MTMSNGTQDKTLLYTPRKTSTEIKPDAPEGEWEFVIPKGKCLVKTTQAGDPRLIIPHKLVSASTEGNEGFAGAEVNQAIIIFDDNDAEKVKGANMFKRRCRSMCEAVGLDFGEVYPTELRGIRGEFDSFFAALEGKKGTCWTVNSTRKMASNEEVTDTEIRYSAPGAGLRPRAVEGGDDDERPGSRKPAGKKGGRR